MIHELVGYPSSEAVRQFVNSMKKVVDKYGWGDEVVHPWANVPMKISKIISDMSDYWKCSRGTKDYLIDLGNGLAKILNAWVEYEENGVWVKIISSGKMVRVERDFAEELVNGGICEMIVGVE